MRNTIARTSQGSVKKVQIETLGQSAQTGSRQNSMRLFVESDVGISFVPVIRIGKKLVEHLGWRELPLAPEHYLTSSSCSAQL